MTHLRIQRPDDWHVHLRDGAALKDVVKFTAERFGRAIVMPNLTPPITTADMPHCPPIADFSPCLRCT
jgi:dihydroorotase